ncbi:hypothetical protein GCK32_011429, partial [Trichostrongylus colubriformis]
VELSEVWTRRNEDLDWDSLICSSDSMIARRQKEAAPRSLDDLTSLKMTKDWIAVAKSDTDVPKTTDCDERSPAGTSPLGGVHRVNMVVRSRRSEETAGSIQHSTTGEEDSRVSFALHDLTGPVMDAYREEELMRYMDVNNLDFNIARRFATTDNEQAYVGTIQKGVFKAKSDISQESIEERILPVGNKRIRTLSQNELKRSLRSSIENVEDLVRQLATSRNELVRLSVDCLATLNAADQMMHRASEWFRMMLDDLEKRIKDETILVSRHQNFLETHINPILRKLHDLTVLYETLNFLDKKTSMNDQTMRTSKHNIQLARESIAKLSSKDSKMKASSTVRSDLAPLAAEISSAFHGFQEALLEVMTFTLSSAAANRLLETILTQMRGIHRVVMKEMPRATLAQYLATLGAREQGKYKAAILTGRILQICGNYANE